MCGEDDERRRFHEAVATGGQARAARHPDRSCSPRARISTNGPPTWPIPGSWSPSAPAATAEHRRTARSPRRTSSRSRRRSANTAPAPASTARSSWARTPTRVSAHAQRTALEVLAANGVHAVIQQDDGVTPTPVISRAILVHNRTARERCGGRDRDHAVAQPAAGRRLQVQPAAWWPGRFGRHDVGAEPRQRAAAPARSVKRMSYDAALSAPTTHQNDFVLPYVQDLATVIDMDAVRGSGLALGVDPLGGASRAYWEPINADLRPRHRRRQSRDRPDVLVHDCRSRRRDPDGLFESLRDGESRWPQGSVSAGVRHRSRRRPPRDRHARQRTDEPQCLPRGRDRLSAGESPGLAARGGRGQDRRQQRPARSCGGEGRPAIIRGAGRVQVVRRRSSELDAVLRRRRERGCKFSPA